MKKKIDCGLIIAYVLLGIAIIFCITFIPYTIKSTIESEKRQEQYELEAEIRKQELSKQMEEFAKEQVRLQYIIKNNREIERKAPSTVPKYDEQYELWKQEIIPVYGDTATNHYQDFLIVNEDVSKIDADYTKLYLDIVPEYIIDNISKLGWKMYLVNENLAEMNGYDSNKVNIGGMTNPTDKTITIWANEEAIRRSVIHEIGHVIDFDVLGDTLTAGGYVDYDSKEFAKIYLYSSQQNIYTYYIRDELVAQLFVEYLLYPRELKVQASRIYSFYDELDNAFFNKLNTAL